MANKQQIQRPNTPAATTVIINPAQRQRLANAGNNLNAAHVPVSPGAAIINTNQRQRF